MNNEERRKTIMYKLLSNSKPIKGTELANEFNVSRQVIVQDIALLRASGNDIIATPQGYIIMKENTGKIIKTIISKHHSYEEMEEELQILIDYGAKIIDVIVEHPIYGEIRTVLDIAYKNELEEFMSKIKKNNAEPLASLTDGVHIHTIEVPCEKSFKKLKEQLLEKDYLIQD
ncbi:transcription repressor NadR [Alkaliphilus pronyensis]|uniref:Transcription repressor NadR n=1 Tax=Alkaliphilus pronyensis TaxID=1482732 RepID=A0A6I0F4P2_9FIRM|nr:transcription repressor NadR [Alkaliphilus pronyensis]KAB3529285.1 transcription repressor NadR [Alkaliphilus pronyensis]